MPPEIVQLGVAGVAVAIIWYVLKLIVDGKLHTDGEIKIRDDRITALTQNVETLTSALRSSNEQSATLMALWKALRPDDEGE